MGELAAEAGLPPGVFNVVTSADPAMAGEMLVTDPRVDLISFTGSTAIGRRVMEKGAAIAEARVPGTGRQVGQHRPR